MSASLLLRSTLPRHIAKQPTLVGAVWLHRAQESTTATAQEEGEFKYTPGGRKSFWKPFRSCEMLWCRLLTILSCLLFPLV